jgi:hypothetical protein
MRGIKPLMQRASVVLPHPLEPAINNSSPGLSSNEILSIAFSGAGSILKG